MRNIRVVSVVCFVLAGTCIGLCLGFIIAARMIPLPIVPESVGQEISKELEEINDKTGGSLEKHTFDENKWLSMVYKEWYNSLSEANQNIIKYHDDAKNWVIRLMGIAIAIVIIGVFLWYYKKHGNI